MSCRHLVLIPVLALALGVQAREQSGSHSDTGGRSESASRSGTSTRSEASSRSDSTSHPLPPVLDGSSGVRAVSDTDAAQMELLNRQKRRDILREALRSQPEEARAAVRQMSLQERTELRQQLRQQQDWYK